MGNLCCTEFKDNKKKRQNSLFQKDNDNNVQRASQYRDPRNKKDSKSDSFSQKYQQESNQFLKSDIDNQTQNRNSEHDNIQNIPNKNLTLQQLASQEDDINQSCKSDQDYYIKPQESSVFEQQNRKDSAIGTQPQAIQKNKSSDTVNMYYSYGKSTENSVYYSCLDEEEHQQQNGNQYFQTDLQQDNNKQFNDKLLDLRLSLNQMDSWGEEIIDFQKIQQILDTAQENIEQSQSDWDHYHTVKNNSGNIFKQKPFNDSNCIKVRADIQLSNVKMQHVLDLIQNFDKRKQWDSKLVEIFIIKKLKEENSDVYYCNEQTLYMVKNRDWLLRRFLKKDYPEKGQVMLIEYSIESKQIPLKQNVVRGYCDYRGYILSQKQQDTHLTVVQNMDYKGDIPQFLINQLSDKGIKNWLDQLITQCYK